MNIEFTAAAVCVFLALLYAFSNGFHDSGNIIASMVSSRALSPRKALIVAAVCAFAGGCLLGSEVAERMAVFIFVPAGLKGAGVSAVLSAGLAAAILWNIAAWLLRLPASSSHALIGGLLGASLGGFGPRALELKGVVLTACVMLAAPLVCFTLTYFVCGFFKFAGRWLRPSVNSVFNILQIISSAGLATASGSNDAQKAMGVIAVALAASGYAQGAGLGAGGVWVIYSSSLFLALGILLGGYRVAKTLGARLCKIRPVQGFAAQGASFGVMLFSSVLGFPVSATQVAASSIMGAGASEGFKRVRWNVFGNILFTWAVTIPVTFALGYLMGLAASGVVK